MPTVLITGYGGFLGAAISRQLLERGFTVRGLARSLYSPLTDLGVVPFKGSVDDQRTVEAAMSGVDAVIHTAAKAGVWGSYGEYYQTNTRGTSLLLAAAIKQQCQAFVFTSSPSVTFDAQNQSGIDESAPYPTRWLCHYPQTKALAEMEVLQSARDGKLLAASLRPHLIWGLGDPHLMPRVVQRAQSGRLKRVGTGLNLIDIVHVENAATAHVLALDKLLAGDQAVSGQAFFITDGKPIGCWEWITRILETAGVQVPRSVISFKLAYRIGAILEGLYRLGNIASEPPMTRFVAAQLALDHYFSIEKARKLLGYNPTQDLDNQLATCRPWLSKL